MNEQILAKKTADYESNFWDDVSIYASTTHDKPFAGEIAYMMVTLYRTGV